MVRKNARLKSVFGKPKKDCPSVSRDYFQESSSKHTSSLNALSWFQLSSSLLYLGSFGSLIVLRSSPFVAISHIIGGLGQKVLVCHSHNFFLCWFMDQPDFLCCIFSWGCSSIKCWSPQTWMIFTITWIS